MKGKLFIFQENPYLLQRQLQLARQTIFLQSFRGSRSKHRTLVLAEAKYLPCPCPWRRCMVLEAHIGKGNSAFCLWLCSLNKAFIRSVACNDCFYSLVAWICLYFFYLASLTVLCQEFPRTKTPWMQSCIWVVCPSSPQLCLSWGHLENGNGSPGAGGQAGF